MGGEGPETEEEDLLALALPSCLSAVKLVDAPILFLVLSHKAFRQELAALHRVAEEAAAAKGSHGHELLAGLRRRFEFLKLVYKYHCAAEDEVIFLALDAQVKNVASTYSLEHKYIDDNFSSIFLCLHLLTNEDGDKAVQFQELVCRIGTIQKIIGQHMRKEEEQVFPLLMQKFSTQEQASLVWKYICSVPIKVLQDFFPWIISLSNYDKVDFLHCIKFVVPKETLLQEVVISWIDSEKQSSSGVQDVYDEGARSDNGLASFKDILSLHPPKDQFRDEGDLTEANASICKTGRQNPVDAIYLWHGAIRKDLRGILEELCCLRSTNSRSPLSSVIVQLKFYVEVLLFYSNAWDHIFYPVMNELPMDGLFPSHERLADESQIEGLQRLLFYKFQDGMQISSYTEMLCAELELFITRVSKSLTFFENQVLPFISRNCSFGMQMWLLYSSLQMMPLGLLKYMVMWFSSHLSDGNSKINLNSINLECGVASKSFTCLLLEWVRIGYSGKISIEGFRKDLQNVFKSRSQFLSEDFLKDTGSNSDEKFHVQKMNNCKDVLLEINSAFAATSSTLNPSSTKQNISYSSGMNMHIFFPQVLEKTSSIQNHSSIYRNANLLVNLESRPMDHMLLFHKALIKDLECLVRLSARLFEDVRLLADFKRRFHLLQFLYQIHSDSEDEIAFPALESIGKLQNISHSYTIDHKLEVAQFRKISHILSDLSLFHGKLDTLGQRKPVYHLLCSKLHDTCISMDKILSDHIYREEIELWPLFGEHFSIKEQEKIVGRMLGRTRAESLQEIIPWLMASITPEEQHALVSLWLKATKNTKFNEWLREWWEGMARYDKDDERSHLPPAVAADPLEDVLKYLSREVASSQGNYHNHPNRKTSRNEFPEQAHPYSEGQNNVQTQVSTTYSSEVDKKRCNKIVNDMEKAEEEIQQERPSQTLSPHEHPLFADQQELEDAIRKVSRDAMLNPKRKAYIVQNLLMSRWIVTQQQSHLDILEANDMEQIPGQCPSYRDPERSVFGCKHYKRNCKLLTPCCNKLYTCIRCHDEMTDHSVDRRAITKMCCMKCLVVQPLSQRCSTSTCDNFTMGRYFCKICKLFDDERQIYHCPYCNLCRVGKGLGIDYFHCMNCNACMSRFLSVHVCREKCFEDNCPICHEYIFTSSSPVKALPCGHLMHSACFQDYTCTNYICPICSKSLGDMQVYFQMLDALLAEEKIPEEYSGQTQVILCNDCEKKGSAAFHWLYHKCPYCGSYNTRLL